MDFVDYNDGNRKMMVACAVQTFLYFNENSNSKTPSKCDNND